MGRELNGTEDGRRPEWWWQDDTPDPYTSAHRDAYWDYLEESGQLDAEE